jgi:transcriptional regulator with XRE-family HTH domain
MLTEYDRARQWRDGGGLSRQKLAELIGYSVSSIQNMENGFTKNGVPISKNSLKSYKLCCAAVASGLTFDWGKVTINLE